MTQPPLSEADQKKLLEIRRKKLDLEAAIPALWVAATDSKGHLDMAGLIKLVVVKIKENDIAWEYDLAAAMVRKVDKKMRPVESKDGQGILSFYDADSYIPIGDNERRKMSHAKKIDLVIWEDIERREFVGVREAYEKKSAYRFNRLGTWRNDEDTLAAVEKRIAEETVKAQKIMKPPAPDGNGKVH